jgi:YD repeat-containing protein
MQTTTTSERGIVTRSYFDDKGRLFRRSTPEPVTASAMPTPPPREVETEYEYWHFDLPRRIKHPLLPASQAMTPAAGPLVTTMTYDLLGRLQSIGDPDSGTTGRRYDAFGQLKRVEDATGAVTTYEYDDAGRLRRVTTPATAAYPSRTGGLNAQDTEYIYDGAPTSGASPEPTIGSRTTTTPWARSSF